MTIAAANRPNLHRLPAKARAASGDQALTFKVTYEQAMATSVPAELTGLLTQLKRSFSALEAAGGVTAKHREQLARVERRAAAMPFLSATPSTARPSVVRNPVASADVSGSEGAKQAAQWVRGLEGDKPSPLPAWLTRVLPFLGGAEPSPAFEALSPAQRTQFMAVVKAADPAGQLALRALLESGRLAPDTLGELARLVDAPLVAGLARRPLLSQTLIELNDPTTVSQKSVGTCAATSVQIKTALERPALYVRLVRELAGPEGKAALPGGTFEREADWNAMSDGGRSLPSQLLQPAFMEFANGAWDYANRDNSEAWRQAPDAALAATAYASADRNRNDVVTAAEFGAVFSLRTEAGYDAGLEGRPATLFDEADGNRDGGLSQAELAAFLSAAHAEGYALAQGSGLVGEQALTLQTALALPSGAAEVVGPGYAPDVDEKLSEGFNESIDDAQKFLTALQNPRVIDAAAQKTLLADIGRHARPASPVYATVIYPLEGGPGFHAVLVTGVSKGQVDYINPWGQEERLSQQAFQGMLVSASVPKARD